MIVGGRTCAWVKRSPGTFVARDEAYEHNGHIGHTGHTEELKRGSIQYGKRLGSEREVECCVTRQQPQSGDVQGKSKAIDYNLLKEKTKITSEIHMGVDIAVGYTIGPISGSPHGRWRTLGRSQGPP